MPARIVDGRKRLAVKIDKDVVVNTIGLCQISKTETIFGASPVQKYEK